MYKRIICVLFSLLLCATIKAEENPIIDSAVHTISTFESTKLSPVKTSILYDVEYNPTYYLIEFEEGYAIISNISGKIAQYDLQGNNPYENDNKHVHAYLGPKNYFCISKEQLLQKNGLPQNPELFMVNKQLHSEKNPNDTSKSNPTRLTMQWTVNIAPSTMMKYSGAGTSSTMWINSTTNYPTSSGYPANGICGPIASAGLLAYYDDHVSNNYVSSSIRTQGSNSPGSLITTLYNYIDYLNMGTVPSNLSYGINVFEGLYSSGTVSSAASSVVSVNSKAKNKINNSKPLCLGTVGELTYGNHWLLGYDYAYDDTGSLFYKCVDNWGSYTAVISSVFVTGVAYIND